MEDWIISPEGNAEFIDRMYDLELWIFVELVNQHVLFLSTLLNSTIFVTQLDIQIDMKFQISTPNNVSIHPLLSRDEKTVLLQK